MSSRRIHLVLAPLLIVACSAAPTDDPAGEADSSDATTTDEMTTAESSSSGDPDASDDADIATSSGSSDETGADTSPPSACDPWAQDCPEGAKCMPYESEPVDTFAWDALGCFPVDADSKQAGDACTVVGNGVSGLDDCELGAMCLGVDTETLMGVCISMCEGTPAAPRCEDPSTTCIVANDGVILVCLPQCDPLVQDCAEGEGCYESGSGGFFCAAQDDTAAGDAAYAEPCASLNFCNPGLMCAPAETVPGCTDEYCCTEFCDTSMGPEQCGGEAGGQVCVAYFTEDAVPPGFDDVGVCSIPQ